MSDYRDRLTSLARAYAQARDISVSRVSTLVRGEGQFFKRIDEGAGCTVDTYEMILQWFSDRWPAEIAWPSGIDRPEPSPTPDPANDSPGELAHAGNKRRKAG